MKTKIFLPVLAMLSLMLFSFTTNTEAKDYAAIEVSENGTYYMYNATFDQHDKEQLIELDHHFANNADAAQLRITISRVRTWNEKDFTEKSFIVSERAISQDILNAEIVTEYRNRLDGIMARYVDGGRRE